MSFRYKCTLCSKMSKSFHRFSQCQECLSWFCTDCTDNELMAVKTHIKSLEQNEEFVAHVQAQGGLKIRNKPWSFNKLCCVDCYNQKLTDLGINLVKNKQPEEKQ